MNNPTDEQIAEFNRVKSQMIVHNGFVCYLRSMLNIAPPVEGFKVGGVASPIHQPSFVWFVNPALVGMHAANS